MYTLTKRRLIFTHQLKTKTMKSAELKQILNIVETHFNTTLWGIKGKRSNMYISEAKAVYSALARELTICSLREIGELINRDHASILHHIKKCAELQDIYPRFKDNFKACYFKVPKTTTLERLKAELTYHESKAIGVRSQILDLLGKSKPKRKEFKKQTMSVA